MQEEIKERINEKIKNAFFVYLDGRAEKKDKKYYKSGIHVSSLDDCVRKVVYRYYHLPHKKRDLAELIKFEVANFIHKLMADAIKQSPDFNLIGAEKKLTKGLPKNVSGKCDLLFTDTEFNITILSDTKTVHPNKFEKYFDFLLMDSTRIQINMYKMGSKKMNVAHPEYMVVTYFDSAGTHDPAFFEVGDIPEAVLLDIVKKYAVPVEQYPKVMPGLHPIEISLDRKTGKIFAKKPWNCDYCEFYGVSCPSWGDDFPSKTKVHIGKSYGGIRIELDGQFVQLEPVVTEYFNQSLDL